MGNTDSDLVARRESAMDRADRAIDKAWPARQGDDYISEMEAAAKELQTVVESMKVVGVGPLETGRTYRYLGSVYSDMAPALGDGLLETAIDAYGHAEEQLRGQDDALEHAKLDFNLGNSMRQFYKNDVGKLEDAEQRFLAARSIFAEQSPQHLAAVDEALTSTKGLIKIASTFNQMSKDRQEVDHLEEQLKSGGDVQTIAEQFQEIRDRDGGAAGKFAKVQELIAGLPQSAKEGEKFEHLQEQMSDLTAAIQDMGSTNDPQEQQILDLLQQRIRKEAADGKVAGSKADALGDLVNEIGKSLGGDDDIATLMERVATLRSKASSQFEMLHYMSHGVERPPEGSRAAELVETCWVLRQFLLEEMNARNKSDGESRLALDMNMRAAGVDKKVYEAGADDALAAAVDNQSLRPFALDVRSFAARHHPMLTQPIWSVAAGRTTTNSVIYAGSEEGRQLVEEACRKLSLELQTPAKGQSIADARFNQIQNAFVAVFDLRAESAQDKGAVAYELGIARVLGKPIVVLANTDQRIPFDIDVEPILLDGSPQDSAAVYDAIDLASVWTMPGPGRSSESIETTIDDVLRQYPRPYDDVYVDQTLKQLEAAKHDPVAANAALKTLVTTLDVRGLRLINTVWPPAYPEPGARQLFHVMPFGPDWADDAAKCAEDVCTVEGARYIRGDRVDDPNIIHSIWKEINVASHILVDMTGFNENVSIELGMTHTLGRTSLIVAQRDTVKDRFPMIAKQRFYKYHEPFDGKLAEAVKTLLNQPLTR